MSELASPARTFPAQLLVSPFSFYSSGDHRDLHSFPTRRSSDLSRSGTPAMKPSVRPTSSTSPPARRSEEHTSELQSRVDLVCRLLLEKKKIQSFYLSA